MACNPTKCGLIVQAGRPDWGPLESSVGPELAGWFMWMFELELEDGSRVHAYKHSATRAYLYLETTVGAFEYVGADDRGRDGCYGEVGLATAITRAFSGWALARPPAGDVRAMRAAIRSARLSA